MIDLRLGSCLVVLPTLDEGSIDSVVCDPPYHLTSIVSRFSKTSQDDQNITSRRCKNREDGYARLARGFMGKEWDSDVAFKVDTWAQVFRVLKPGGHLLAFGGTRTYHRMVCAIEDAGFEIRDQLGWVYGSGFPKSHDVAKGIDRTLGHEGSYGEPRSEAHAYNLKVGRVMRGNNRHAGWQRPWMEDKEAVEKSGRTYIPKSNEAKQWQGWGTALKPAWEPIVLARKALSESTIAKNVLAHGTSAINIDEGRIEDRWPANLIHDGSEDVLKNLPDGAAKFFYCAKTTTSERGEYNNHPTVKPVALMRYLCKLITRPNGIVLDPFMGSGSTGLACVEEQFRFIGIELEKDNFEIASKRIGQSRSGRLDNFFE